MKNTGFDCYLIAASPPGAWTADPGEFELMVDGNAESWLLKTVVELE
jgi:hypothetical protein